VVICRLSANPSWFNRTVCWHLNLCGMIVFLGAVWE
jgi:hypothetical protein